jgi:hypothetical protein
MVKNNVKALHEPERRTPDRPVSSIEPPLADPEIGAPLLRQFMVAMRGQKNRGGYP